jgi:hypothetical protein
MSRQSATTTEQPGVLKCLRRLQVLRDRFASSRDEQTFPILLFIVSSTQEFRCTNPRDQVFSLIGVSRSSQLRKEIFPLPDYTASVKSVFCTATKLIIEEMDSLAPLQFAQGESVKQGEEPSWCRSL